MPSRIILALGIAALSAGCADKPMAPARGGPANIRIAAAVSAQASGAEAIDVFVGYNRTGGERVELLKHRTSISGTSTQNVSVPVDLTSCLADDSRPQPLDVCVLRIDVVLRDANDVALDSVAASPVNAAPGGSVSPASVELSAGTVFPLSFCAGPFGAVFAAFQDGSGPWKPVPIANGAGSIRMRSTHGGVVWVQPMPAGGYVAQGAFLAASELSVLAVNMCRSDPGTATITGTVPGLAPGEVAYVTMGGVQRSTSFPNTALSLPNVPSGPQDLVSVRLMIVGNSSVPTGVIVRRNINVQGSATIPAIDFSTSTAPTAFPITVSNVGAGENTTWATLLLTANTRLGSLAGSGNTVTGTWHAVPASLTIPSDLHLLSVTALNIQDLSASRTVQSIMATPAARSVTFGPPLSIPTIAVVSTQPYALLRATIPVQPEYVSVHTFISSQVGVTPADNRAWSMQVTQGYRAGSSVATIEIPNFSGLQGWSNDWGLKPGVATSWTVTGATTNGTLFQPYVAGGGLTGATRNGTITP